MALSQTSVCNGYTDCPSGEDELNCQNQNYQLSTSVMNVNGARDYQPSPPAVYDALNYQPSSSVINANDYQYSPSVVNVNDAYNYNYQPSSSVINVNSASDYQQSSSIINVNDASSYQKSSSVINVNGAINNQPSSTVISLNDANFDKSISLNQRYN